MNLYEAEEIIEKKWFNDEKKFKYKIKWRGYSIHECSWEETSNIDDKLIKNFEEKNNIKDLNKEIKTKQQKTSEFKINEIIIEKPTKILGMKREKNELICLVEWESKDNVNKNKSIVKYEFFKKQYPLIVLDFFEKRLKFV